MKTPDTAPAFTEAELARRRAGARRLAWVLGALVLAIYLVGMLFKR
jgi:hypothetical protein